ncbi:uncharacterized protein LOC111318938 [Stylophora pistillata]|uniref:uncharacterized protein LOC111318938 n=1 Tax=Stylophora pistillata TaxID=50429 RepID=UPI000C044DE8|nr:uncharacterized protein LOC111318938 [Stylophora pistillata]
MGNVLGNRRMAPHFLRNYRKNVCQITSPVLGAEVRRVENKMYLDGHDQTTIKFLKAAIHFLPTAMEDGADLTNALFRFVQWGSEFVIKAGNGDWEYYFSEEYPDQITDKCVRRPWLKFLWPIVGRFRGTQLALPGPF